LKDQAKNLRKLANFRENTSRVIAITSGKGGVGKTILTANLAIALAKKGKKVLVLDADLGLANIDVVLGLNPKYNLQHLIYGEKSIDEIMVDGPEGIKILPASSGIQELTELSSEEVEKILSFIKDLDKKFDFLLIDTAAGITKNVINFSAAASEIIVILTPEPTSLTDGYAVIKVINKKTKRTKFNLLINMVKNEKEADEIFARMSLATNRFLHISPDYLGYILYDKDLILSIKQQIPVLELYPYALSSRCIKLLAEKLLNLDMEFKLQGNIRTFFRRLANLLKKE